MYSLGQMYLNKTKHTVFYYYFNPNGVTTFKAGNLENFYIYRYSTPEKHQDII